MRRTCLLDTAIGLASLVAMCGAGPALAETMSSALARAYDNNPDINAQRAAVRAKDEGVPTAKAGWLPKANGTYSAGHSAGFTGTPGTEYTNRTSTRFSTNPRGPSLTISQIVFDGNRTSNNVRAAESSVLAARESMRYAELTTLQQGATAYMDVLRDIAVVDLRRQNIKVLEVQLQQTRDRFQVGEVTRTDVAQAESSLATGNADYAVAQSQLDASTASFRRLIGVQPKQLQPAQPIEKLLPRTLEQATAIGLAQNPQIVGALHQVDVNELQVKVAEAALLPSAGVQGTASQQIDALGVPGYNQTTVGISAVINIPFYQGGAEYAAVRQAKEVLGQARLAVDSQRIVVRGAIATAWGQLAASRASIVAFQAAVKASEVALNGVREEAKVGQRTTLDVLNAQQTLLNARVQLVQAQHDRVVSSYNVYAAIGLLSAEGLGLGVSAYDPNWHYDATKNRFFGLSTMDGR